MKATATRLGLPVAWLCLAALLVTPSPALADTHYVNISNAVPVAPYTNWVDAATNIQDAVDAAESNDVVLVSNGVYQAGTRVTPGYSLLNRVVITNTITVQSVNGSELTIIRGQGPLGSNAVRCVYLGTNALLDGFTLTDGFTRTAGDYYMDRSGGGAYAKGASLTNCLVTRCSAAKSGGGIYHGSAYRCRLTGNSADSGGGTCASLLRNCFVWNNTAALWGGGVSGGSIHNCTLTGNFAGDEGGGTHFAGGQNNVVYYNTAGIAYDNWAFCALYYSCTTPHAGDFTDITNAPMFVSPGHIASNSPCVGKGGAFYARGADIDGDGWDNPPAVGCDEPTGPYTGALSVAVAAEATNSVPGVPVEFDVTINGRVSANEWDFGDGNKLTNRMYLSHAWAATGGYDVVFTVFNDSNPGGVAATVTVHVVSPQATAKYVWTNSPSSGLPYDSWSNAAHTIQEAVDAQTIHGGWVLVTNGVYDSGARQMPDYMRSGIPGLITSNRVTITNNVQVRSVNGPAVTIIEGVVSGSNAVRCVFMNAGVLDGFALVNGGALTNDTPWQYGYGGGAHLVGGTLIDCLVTNCSTRRYGGGVYGGTLRNCTVTDCDSSRGAGVAYSTMYNCLIVRNRATEFGGGAYWSTLHNCTVVANFAQFGGSGGGADACELRNTI
ncbi:PKD domain-containing protein, partial [Verrucomicrobiota bacterium]